MPAGSIIVVSHNSESCIEACLRALIGSQGWQIMVVDNLSHDQSLELARRFEPHVVVLANSENRGFAGAVNQGVKAAQTEICVILNPDAVASPNAVEELAKALAPDEVGLVGGSLTRKGAPEIGFNVRRFPTLISAIGEVLLINRLWPNNPWNRKYRCLDLDYSVRQEVEQPAGACFAVKRAAWEDINGFDEDFFPVWFEDVDFCRRLRNRGWKIIYTPHAIFAHSGAHSVNKLRFGERQAYWYSNLIRYFSKHHSASAVACLRAAIIAGLFLRAVLACAGFRPHDVAIHEAVSAYCRTAWRYGLLGRVA
jgi:N-acetylglucosaminyl-diphospho-decaprenol L-rhamnosyltransferase